MKDILLIEFYIKKKYNQTIAQYFDVTPSCVTLWKRLPKLKPKQKKYFLTKENLTADVTEVDLIKHLYNK